MNDFQERRRQKTDAELKNSIAKADSRHQPRNLGRFDEAVNIFAFRYIRQMRALKVEKRPDRVKRITGVSYLKTTTAGACDALRVK